MKTVELTGHALDYWVAMAEGMALPYVYMPSRNWLDGGPIIEREKMSVAHVDDGHGVGWVAYMPAIHHGFGATPLIAAMRAYVASKYGDEVPDDRGRSV